MSTGGWVAIWVLLILAALVFYALIALRLYRKAKVVLRQASTSAEVFDAFTLALEDAQTEPFETSPALMATNEARATWRRTRRVNRVRRAKRKALRRQETLQRWREIPIPTSKT